MQAAKVAGVELALEAGGDRLVCGEGEGRRRVTREIRRRLGERDRRRIGVDRPGVTRLSRVSGRVDRLDRERVRPVRGCRKCLRARAGGEGGTVELALEAPQERLVRAEGEVRGRVVGGIRRLGAQGDLRRRRIDRPGVARLPGVPGRVDRLHGEGVRPVCRRSERFRAGASGEGGCVELTLKACGDRLARAEGEVRCRVVRRIRRLDAQGDRRRDRVDRPDIRGHRPGIAGRVRRLDRVGVASVGS